MIHFGRNPRIGGSPPKDNSDVKIMNQRNLHFPLRIGSYFVLGIPAHCLTISRHLYRISNVISVSSSSCPLVGTRGTTWQSLLNLLRR